MYAFVWLVILMDIIIMLVGLICNLNLHMSMCNSSFHNYASQTCLAGTLIDGFGCVSTFY